MFTIATLSHQVLDKHSVRFLENRKQIMPVLRTQGSSPNNLKPRTGTFSWVSHAGSKVRLDCPHFSRSTITRSCIYYKPPAQANPKANLFRLRLRARLTVTVQLSLKLQAWSLVYLWWARIGNLSIINCFRAPLVFCFYSKFSADGGVESTFKFNLQLFPK